MVDYSPKGKAIPKHKLSTTQLNIGRYLKNHPYIAGMGLSRYGDGRVVPIEIKGRDTSFGLGFQSSQKDIEETLEKKREKKLARNGGKSFDQPTKMPHMSITFSFPFCNNKPQFPLSNFPYQSSHRMGARFLS